MASQLTPIEIPDDPEISSLMEDFTSARKELARAQASDDRVGEVLAAGRVMAIQLEDVVQDCSGCAGTGLTLVHDKKIDCPDCAQVRQAIREQERADLVTVQLPKKELVALTSYHWHAGYPSTSSGPLSAWHREVYEALTGREWTVEGERKLKAHPAAAPQPAPTGEGVDVILDLVARLRTEPARVEQLIGEDLALARRSCTELGWDLEEALLARRAWGMRPVAEGGYGRPLLTGDGRNNGIDLGQERHDGVIYRWKGVLEGGGAALQPAPAPAHTYCAVCSPARCSCDDEELDRR